MLDLCLLRTRLLKMLLKATEFWIPADYLGSRRFLNRTVPLTLRKGGVHVAL